MHFKKKTKIVITMGPASEDKHTIEQLIVSGVNVFRFNMKHGTFEWHHEVMGRVQEVADNLGSSIGILIDLQGPEIRIQTKDQEPIILKAGQVIKFARKWSEKDALVRLTHNSILEALDKGDKFTIDDGYVRMEVVETDEKKKWFKAKILEDGTIKHQKSMNLYNKDVKLPSLIQDDIDRLKLADKKRVDYVALSFVRNKRDIEHLRKVMAEKNIKAHIVAKVESQAAIENIDEIIEHSDVVMIARGDLGIEAPIEKLAYYQKMIINKCRHANTPVIVATQMLESMINNPIPTRAEATDVANAVLDGADALMLSGETALGKYPVRAVKEMAKIAQFNESKSEMIQFDITPSNATELIVEAAETIAENANKIKIDHIIVMTETGYTARVLAAFRPQIPIIAITDQQKTVETLTLSYGVEPVHVPMPDGRLLSLDSVIKKLKKTNIIEKGEVLLIIHGQHWKQPGQTNAIVLLTVE